MEVPDGKASFHAKLYRWTIVFLLSGFYFVANFTIGAITPVAPLIFDELGPVSSRDTYQSLFVAIWGYGQAAGPLFMGPLSERFGRLPVLHVSNLLFIIFCAGGALSTNVPMVVGFRFLMALTNTSSALNGPIVGDIFPPRERAKAMALNQIVSVIGTGLGPVGGGLVAEDRGWRWSFWLIAIITAGFEIPLLICYKESYRPKLEGSLEISASWTGLLGQMLRPFKMFTAPVVFLLSIYGTVAYGVAYIVLSTIVELLTDVYGFGLRATSFSFIGFGIGMVTGGLLYIFFMDRYIQLRIKQRGGGPIIAEYYLPPTVFGGLLMPIGLFMYGWNAEKTGPWAVCFVGSGFLACGVLIFMVVANNYLVSAFGKYAASAIAISMVMRFIGSAVLPLAGPPLYARLGYGWGNSLLAFVTLAFVAVPVALMRFGERWRAIGSFKDLSEEKEVLG